VADPLKPWIWQLAGESGWTLVDAEFYYLAFVNRVTGFKDGDPKQPMEIPSAVTRERIALVPLMEELLRKATGDASSDDSLESCIDNLVEWYNAGPDELLDHALNTTIKVSDQMRALLARIDAAKATPEV